MSIDTNENYLLTGAQVQELPELTRKGFIDTAVSTTSEYPVQNKAITAYVNSKISSAAIGETETYTIAAAGWSELADASPFTYSATVTATHTITDDTIIELYNDNPVLFANYGFSIASVSGQTLTIYATAAPEDFVELSVNYKEPA